MNEITGLRTRAQIIDAVALQIQDNSTQQRTIIGNWLDQAYRVALRRYEWPQLIRDNPTGVSIGATDIYFHLPKEQRYVIKLVDATSPFVLRNVDAQALFEHTRGFPNLTGEPGEFSPVGIVGMNTTLDAATALEVVSDGADTRTGFITGFDTNDERVRETFTLNGTTDVNLSNSLKDVLEFKLDSQDNSRRVSLRKQSDATVLATIAGTELSAEYMRFRLSAAPGRATTYHVIYKYTPPAIFNDDDKYIIPVEDYLIHYAISRHYMQRRQSTLSEQEMILAEAQLRHIQAEVETSSIKQASPTNPRRRPLGVIVEGPSS